MAQTMRGAVLPGNSTVELREYPVPQPGHGQVLLKMKASTICGSDIRAIYREHLGKGPEGYRGVICGHEPSGQIVATGPDMRRFKEGDRVFLYHISGCGRCHECRTGYQISCTSPLRAAYGWQRDGGNADYCLADEADCILIPDSMSYIDGACVACGFGTCYEAIRRIGVSGDDTALVVGLGPMGLASLMLARARGATKDRRGCRSRSDRAGREARPRRPGRPGRRACHRAHP
jgi:threonine dehydrogenase-like Zn-dependent dehydrogenase